MYTMYYSSLFPYLYSMQSKLAYDFIRFRCCFLLFFSSLFSEIDTHVSVLLKQHHILAFNRYRVKKKIKQYL